MCLRGASRLFPFHFQEVGAKQTVFPLDKLSNVYAESFRDQAHLDPIVKETQVVVSRTLAGSKVRIFQ